jgi:F-type H+-transporting ATPase subunit delta
VTAGADPAALAATYAEALAEAAESRGALEETGASLAAFAQAWERERDLQAFFLSAAVPREAKRAALERLRRLSGDLVADFLQVLLGRSRMSLLPEAAAALRALLDRRLGRVPVVLETATEAAASDVEAWRGRLRAVLGKEPVLAHRVRPALIGGAVIRVGDVVADGSVRRRLREVRDRALRASRERSSAHALPA